MSANQSVASVVPMSVSVQVLVVDGTRRMSHKFFDQIARRGVIEDDGSIVDGADIWGQARVITQGLNDYGQTGVDVVWTRDGHLYRAIHWTDPYAHEPDHSATVNRLRDELPQLFIGG